MSDRTHQIACRAVARDRIGVPNCPDWRLSAASEAGLISFVAWPSGQWTLTDAGRVYLSELNAANGDGS